MSLLPAWIRNELVFAFTAIVTGWNAAIAAGWQPAPHIAWIAAGLIAALGLFIVREGVTPYVTDVDLDNRGRHHTYRTDMPELPGNRITAEEVDVVEELWDEHPPAAAG